MGDHRWDETLVPLVEEGEIDPRWADLAIAIPPARRGDTRYHVYFDDSLTVDRLHAEHLIGLEGLRLYRFGYGRHHLVRVLREVGALERILRKALHVPLDDAELAGPEPQASVGDDVS
jgi:hypothetical protein